MTFAHTPVMLQTTLDLLDPGPGMVYVDATIGGGGHAAAVAERLGPDGHVFGIDRDPRALEAAGARLEQSGVPFTLRHGCFGDLASHLDAMGVTGVDLLLADLGLSSPQVDDARRGFSYREDAPLDMRMDPTAGVTAAEWLETADEETITDVLRRFGEERYARRIARGVIAERGRRPVRTTAHLVEVVRRAVPAGGRKSRGHPARRTFQAIRIAVNDELGELSRLLEHLPFALRPGGRAAIITFHSLEDRQVKYAFRDGPYDLLTKKPERPDAAELEANPRSRSAKLRAVRRNNDRRDMLDGARLGLEPREES